MFRERGNSLFSNPIIIIAPYVPYRKKRRKEEGHRGKGRGKLQGMDNDGTLRTVEPELGLG